MNMNNIEMLMQLQQDYKSIDGSNKILKDGSYICTLKKMKMNFEKMKKEYKENENRLNKIKTMYESIDEEINEERMCMEKEENKLYNDASEMKLINSLQNSIENRKQKIKSMEDKIIELMEQEEKLCAQKDSFRVKLIDLKENFYEYKEISNKKIITARGEMERAKRSIEKLRNTIPEELLSIYDTIRDRKGNAVARLEGGVCSGCRMRVSAMTIDSIYKNEKIIYCDQCGRILYYDETCK